MKGLKVAINGFGRIGRAVFRIALERGINIVAVNDPHPEETLVYLLKHDSVYGNYDKKVEFGEGWMKVGNKKINLYAERDPENLPWKNLGVDIVVESTGVFKDREGASKHLTAGAKKVLISAPGKDTDSTIVMGVNDNDLKKNHKIVSMASCTTNCIAPLVKVLHEAFNIKRGYLTTIHAYTGDQSILDCPHKKLRRGRSAAINLVPTSSGAAKAVGEVIPAMKGKIGGIAVRAPVACGSITDFVCIVGKNVTSEEINHAVKIASRKMKDILEYSEEELVSTDIIKNPHSSIFDSKLTEANGNMVKVFSWYDNEYGYSSRMVDLLERFEKMES